MTKSTKTTATTTENVKSTSKKAATATKPASKKVATKPAPVEKTPRAIDPTRLRKPQLRLLEVLAKAKGPMNRHMLNEKANVDLAWISEYCGKLDPQKRAAADEKYNVRSFVTRGWAKVREIMVEGRGEIVWEITAQGKKALETARKEAAA